MTYPPNFHRVRSQSYGENTPYYIDDYSRIYDKNKKQIKCKICNSHLEYVPSYGVYCSDNLLHKV